MLSSRIELTPGSTSNDTFYTQLMVKEQDIEIFENILSVAYADLLTDDINRPIGNFETIGIYSGTTKWILEGTSI